MNDGPEEVNWIFPLEKPCVLMFHDESTFRCGEQTAKRWFKKDKQPFVSKGRGKSLMVSDFLITHPSGPFFKLSENEWHKCCQKYPNIVDFHGVYYEDKTCTGSIQPGHENYFCSETVLNQFERLFQMIEFKEEYNKVKHDIEIVVDNARTHTAQVVNINEFRLHPNGHCPVETLEFTDDNGETRTIECFDEAGVSKGLKKIAVELGYDLPDKLKVDKIRAILIEHPAFCPTIKLNKLAEKYGVKIIFCPKFHCELNPTEGLWCNQKQYVRKRTDQTFVRLHKLLVDSRIHFAEIKLGIKLIRRFWKCLKGYQDGESFCSIMKQYFSGKSTGKNKNHTKIVNSQIT